MIIRLLSVVGLAVLLCLPASLNPQMIKAVQPTTRSLSDTVTVVGSDSAPAGSFGVERVLCPAGTVAVGGGIDLENVLTMQVTSSGPTFDQGTGRLFAQPDGTGPAPNGWQASALNTDASSRTFKVAAICAPVADIVTVIGSDSAPAGSFAAERVLCPAGTVAVGGGIDLENVLTMQVTSSGPTFDQSNARLFAQPDGSGPAPNGWQASALNTDASSRTFKVAAICAPVADIVTVIGSDSAPAGSFAAERVLCPAGTVAVGGGIDLENVLIMQVTSSGPTFDQSNARLFAQPDGTNPAPNGWQASALNTDASSRTFKVAAICGQRTFSTFLPIVVR